MYSQRWSCAVVGALGVVTVLMAVCEFLVMGLLVAGWVYSYKSE